MAKSDLRVFVGLFIFLDYVVGACGGDYCFTDHESKLRYCKYGCCGDSDDRYCCPATLGMVIGIVAAGVLVIAILVGVVFCCYHMQKRKGRVATNVQPTTVPPSTIHIIHQPWPTMPTMPTQGWPQPPVYSHGPPPGYYDSRQDSNFQQPIYPGYCPPDPDTTEHQPVPPSAPYGKRMQSSGDT